MSTYGRRGHTIVEGKREALLALCKEHEVRRLALFGSAASGGFDSSKSDLDFLVEYEPHAAMSRADRYFGLLFGLEALFGRHVDLVEREAIKNPFFRESVEETQVTLYDVRYVALSPCHSVALSPFNGPPARPAA